MTDIDNGLLPFKDSWSSTNDKCGTSSAAGTTARPWVLIADDRFFYFFCWPAITGTSTPLDSDGATSSFFFGDIVSRYGSDPFGCVLGSYQANAYYGPMIFGMYGPEVTSAYYYLSFPRAISGVAAPIRATLVRGGGPGAVAFPGLQGVPYVAGGQILISRPHINDGAIHTMRGFLPGFYYPCHPLAFSNLQQVSADGKTFLSFRNFYSGQNCNHFVSLDDWRA